MLAIKPPQRVSLMETLVLAERTDAASTQSIVTSIGVRPYSRAQHILIAPQERCPGGPPSLNKEMEPANNLEHVYKTFYIIRHILLLPE